MKIARLRIQNFRGIKEATLLFNGHVVLVGDNNVGKSTVFEAIDLALGPDRLGRHPKIDEHDFYLGNYLTPPEQPRKEVIVEVVVTDLTDEQQNVFGDEIEWWNTTTKALQEAPGGAARIRPAPNHSVDSAGSPATPSSGSAQRYRPPCGWSAPRPVAAAPSFQFLTLLPGQTNTVFSSN
jgi:hypothetical protein